MPPAPKPPVKEKRPRVRLKPGGPIKKKKRTKAEFNRIYGGDERRDFVCSLPCVAWTRRRMAYGNCEGRVQAAHVKTGGKGRKSDAEHIVPMCFKHHEESHHGVLTFQAKYGVDLSLAAAETQKKWMEFLNSQTERKAS